MIIAHTRVDFATDAARAGLTVPARPTLAAVMERKMALGRAGGAAPTSQDDISLFP